MVVTNCLLPRKQNAEKESRVRLKQSRASFFTRCHAIVATHVVPPFIFSGLPQNRPGFSIALSSSPIECGGRPHCLRPIDLSPVV